MNQLNHIQKRFLLFLLVCIGIRVIFVYIAKTIDVQYLPYLGYLSILPAIGFFYIYITDSRKTGAEVFGDKIWWNYLRPIHGIFYGLFAFHAIQKNPQSWMILLADVVLGLVSFLSHHYSAGHLSKIFV